MDLIEAQIFELKNLNLIYVFSTDNILKNNLNKYIGAKVVYEKDKIISLDYKSKHFSKFIKQIINRYNKEKDRRNIILLGDLTKKLVQESFFTIEESNNEFNQQYGILVNDKDNQIRLYEKHIELALKQILTVLYNYEYIRFDSIEGFNNKYVVNYHCPRKKQLFMLVFFKEDGTLDFRISNVDKKIVNISGTIMDKFNSVEIIYNDSINKINGNIIFDTEEKLTKQKIYKDDEIIYSKENTDTLLEEDEQLISFYLNLCNLDKINNVMKIGEHSYLLSDFNSLVENEDGIFYNNKSCKIRVTPDMCIINYKEKNGISKYNNQIKISLDEKNMDFIFKQIEIDNKFYILVEKSINKNKYSYNMYELNQEENLLTLFDITNNYNILEELKYFDNAKQYIKKMKVGEYDDTI